MKFYLAPMEGITGYIYRNTHAKYFGQLDKYITPFISLGEESFGVLKSKEFKEIWPQNNEGLNVAVQVLTNSADSFIHMAERLKELGYREINLNLGCPSKTVTTKAKGAGFLAYPERLNAFFYRVFEEISRIGIRVSVKTRLGVDEPKEFERLLDIYGRYPISEMIIHPRVQRQLYGGKPDLAAFETALSALGAASENRTDEGTDIVYNGDIFTRADYGTFSARFPQVQAVMLGRGVIANPGLAEYLKTGKTMEKDRLFSFYHELSARYREEIGSDKNTLCKLKELWFYMVNLFDGREENIKRIKRAGSLMELNAAAKRIIKERQINMDGGFWPP